MKKIILVSIVVLSVLALFTAKAGNTLKSKAPAVANAANVEVYYFHYTRRCITCNAVESVTKEALAEIYPELIKNGKIKFTSVNLDEDGSKEIAKQCQAEGQSLLFITKNKRIDLTDKGFLYAKSSPEKLKAEVKKTIDALLK